MCGGVFAVSQHTIRGDRALCLALFSCLLLGFTLLFHCSGPSLNDWKKMFHLPRPRWPLTPRIFIQAQTHRCTPLPSRPHLCFCLSVVCFCSILPFTSSAKFSSLLKSSPISIHRPCVRFPSSPAGLDSARIRQAGQIAGQSSSRRLGDYRVKFNYNEIDVLRWSRKKTQNMRFLSFNLSNAKTWKGYTKTPGCLEIFNYLCHLFSSLCLPPFSFFICLACVPVFWGYDERLEEISSITR